MKNRDKKYKDFKTSYESSGMTQKEFSNYKGISPSLVSYYLRKARELDMSKEIMSNSVPGFQQLELIAEDSKVLCE